MSAVVSDASVDSSTDVEAVLNYTRNTGVRPVNYTFEPPPGVPRNSGEIDARSVTIHDARRINGLTLDHSGFEMISHRSTLSDWRSFQDPERVKAIDYPEVITALKAKTGADKVVIFDHTLRDSSVEAGQSKLREAVRRVHDDQTLDSAPRRVAKHLDPSEAAWRLQRRFAILNFWRPVGQRVQKTPLAVCDARTIDPEDLIPSDLVYPDWTGETYSIAFNPRHRWYWYPDQTPSEATLLKIYDSATDGRARLSAHTAFEDPTGAPDAPARLSIEVRSIVFW
jgi:hypothetical protein